MHGRAGRRRGSIGYAVVGLGHIAQSAVLPAFAHAKENARLAALVSGDRRKRAELSKRYGVPAYDYAQYEECLARDDVDAVYIAVPNDMHREFTIRAARAGAHVLCEKPMATSSAECEEMIRACAESDVKLMIAYRLHFEGGNLAAAQAVRERRIGEPRTFLSSFSYQVKPPNIRLEGNRGGGPTWDIGIYCVNAARYLVGDEPTEVMAVMATGGDERFTQVEQGVAGILRFPDERLAVFSCNYASSPTAWFEVVGSKGRLRLENAYEYVGDMELMLELDGRKTRRRVPSKDQFAPELVYFSRCILEDELPEPDGEEGLADVRIIEALFESARTGRAIRVERVPRRRRPSLEQAVRKPPVEEPALVEAEPPAY